MADATSNGSHSPAMRRMAFCLATFFRGLLVFFYDGKSNPSGIMCTGIDWCESFILNRVCMFVCLCKILFEEFIVCKNVAHF